MGWASRSLNSPIAGIDVDAAEMPLDPSRSARNVVWIYLSAVVFAFIVASRLVAIIDAPDIWHDEAMLMANLPVASVGAALQPLPYYGQAAPAGYLLLASGVSLFAGDADVLGLRLLSLLGSVAAALVMARTFHRLDAGPVAPVALALIFLSPFGLRYGIEIKQYAFELLATALMLHAVVRVLQDARRIDLVLLAGAGVFAIGFTFAAPVLIAAFTFGAAIQLWVWKAQPWRSPVIGVLAALTGAAAIWHFTVTAPATALNFASWEDTYAAAYLSVPVLRPGPGPDILGFFSIMLGMFDPFYRMSSGYYAARTVAVIGMLALFIGLFSLSRRNMAVAATGFTLLAGLAVLSLLGRYPILFTRHFIFIQPVIGIVIATGFVTLSGWFGRRRADAAPDAQPDAPGAQWAIAAFVAASGIVALIAGGNQHKQDLSGAVATILATTGDQDVLLYVRNAAQPVMRMLAPDFKTQIGYGPNEMDADPAKRAPEGAFADLYAAQIARFSEIWSVNTLVYPDDHIRDQQFLDSLAAVFGPCTEVSRSGAAADLGYTLVHRCRPVAGAN